MRWGLGALCIMCAEGRKLCCSTDACVALQHYKATHPTRRACQRDKLLPCTAPCTPVPPYHAAPVSCMHRARPHQRTGHEQQVQARRELLRCHKCLGIDQTRQHGM